MKNRFLAILIAGLGSCVSIFAAPLRSDNSAWNVNRNPDGSNPAAYFGEWPGHTYFPSPSDWRKVPIYQFITDRFADGNPENNEGRHGGYNLYSVMDRHGGDFIGVKNQLAYIKSLGYQGIWISPIFQNRHNSYHGYGQIDFTVLDDRFGTLTEFRSMVDRAHELGMYVIVDIIVNHMSDLYHFEGFPNGNAPFKLHQGEYRLIPHNASEHYEDFKVNNTFNPSGKYTDVYDSFGWRVADDYAGLAGSFWESDFHHNGDLRDYGNPWQNHLGKIYGSLDDLRTSHPRVQDKIIAMTKALVSSTDIDGIRMDTPMQVPLSFFKRWAPAVKAHAASLGKHNFFIFGEFYCERGRAATMVNRGKEPSMWGDPSWFISNDRGMDAGINYPLYWSFFQPAVKDQVNGNLQNLKESYYLDWLAFDFYNPWDQQHRYLHLNFYNNHDQWRVSVASDGFKKTDLGSAIIAFWPGIPLFYYGDEQNFSTFGTALDGWSREDMMTSLAWNNVDSVIKPNPARIDNFNMTHSQYRYVQKVMNVRAQYPALNQTDEVVERWKQVNNANGIYAFSRIYGTQKDWALVVFNTWKDTLSAGGSQGIFYTGWNEGDTIVNVMNPSETIKLGVGGRINTVWVGGYETKVFVRLDGVKPLQPVVTGSFPKHDDRVSGNYTLRLFFSEAMDEASLKSSFRLNDQPVNAGSLNYDAAKRELTCTWNIPDGLHHFGLTGDARSAAGLKLMGPFRSRFRCGTDQNIICNPSATTDAALIANGSPSVENKDITLHHKATGAEKFRVRNESGSWSTWMPYEPVTDWSLSSGMGTKTVTVQYWADNSAAYLVSDTIERAMAGAITGTGNVWHFPFSGDIDPVDDLWVNLDIWPAATATHVEAYISTNNGISWQPHIMKLNKTYSDRETWHLNLGKFPHNTSVLYWFKAWDGAGRTVVENRGGLNYSAKVNAGQPVKWTGNVYHYPFNGSIDPGDDFWVNIESWPMGAAVSGRVVYSLNNSGIWQSAPLVKSGTKGNNDWFNLNMGTFPAGTTIRYAFEIIDGTGKSIWQTNGGKDFTATVN